MQNKTNFRAKVRGEPKKRAISEDSTSSRTSTGSPWHEAIGKRGGKLGKGEERSQKKKKGRGKKGGTSFSTKLSREMIRKEEKFKREAVRGADGEEGEKEGQSVQNILGGGSANKRERVGGEFMSPNAKPEPTEF